MLQLMDLKLKCTLSVAQLNIRGVLNQASSIKCSLTSEQTLKGSLAITNMHDIYAGDTIVTPSSQQQILETKNKLMADDVNIKEIPTYEVSNDYGTTFYIAKELDE